MLATSLVGNTLQYIDPGLSANTTLQSIALGSRFYGIIICRKPHLEPRRPPRRTVRSRSCSRHPDGKRVGFDPTTETSYAEVPGSSYTDELPILTPDDAYTDEEVAALEPTLPRLLTIPEFESGAYQVEVFGTASGPFSINFTGLDGSGGAAATQLITGTASAGSEQTFTFTPKPNVPPVAADDGPIIIHGTSAVSIPVLSNDHDPDGVLDPTSVEIVSPPVDGTAVPQADGTVRYTPGPGSSGTDTFTYVVWDTGGARSNTATVTVQHDDTPISITSVSQYPSSSGNTPFAFTVTLAAACILPVSVDYATADGTATVSGNDYKAQSGTLTFEPGQTTQTITINVTVGQDAQSDLSFFVNLVNPINGQIPPGGGKGSARSSRMQPELAITSTTHRQWATSSARRPETIPTTD